MKWFSDGDYEVVEVLWEGASRLQRIQPRGSSQDFILEEREFADEAAASAASAADLKWQQWLTFCHHPALLLPLECRSVGQQALVVYPGKGSVSCWPVYVEQVFQEYMADEGLCLELAFRLSLIWGALVGKGLRPVALEKPRPEMVLLTGDGDVRALPPRFTEQEDGSLLRGMAELLFAALTRQAVDEHSEFLSHCRDLNREITADAEAIVRRCLADAAEAFDGTPALTRALTRLHIRRDHDQEPYRDSGPLVAFRPYAPDRDHLPEIQEAVDQQGAPPSRPGRRFWIPDRFLDIRHLPLMLLVIYGFLLTPLLFTQLSFAASLPAILAITVIYWMIALAVYHGYRRRNVER